MIFLRLLEKFGSPREVFQASFQSLTQLDRVGPTLARAILEFSKQEEVSRELERLDKLEVRMILYNTREYPPLLANIPDPPPILFVRGNILPQDSVAVAIVGSRAASQQGLAVTRRLARELARAGITIVSGMARGIDSEAHKGALAGGGRTLAVLGCGPNVIYPPENRELFFRIIEQGAVLTEYPLDAGPEAVHFPSRNRLISGLCLGVTVVEAAPQSGSLITARLALEQGREVFAVPGHVDFMRSRGTNRLIRQGARLVESAEDILEELGSIMGAWVTNQPELSRCDSEESEMLSEEEEKLLSLLEEEQAHIDTIIMKSGLSASKTGSLLLQLELKGRIRQLPGKRFVRCS